MVIVVDVARILIHQAFDVIVSIEHQHQRDDGKLTTSTRVQIFLSTVGIGFDGGDELLHISSLNGFARPSIYFIGILILRIVGEVATDNEEILVIEIRLQHLCHPLQFLEVVSGNDDRNDGRHLFDSALQEWQLHL